MLEKYDKENIDNDESTKFKSGIIKHDEEVLTVKQINENIVSPDNFNKRKTNAFLSNISKNEQFLINEIQNNLQHNDISNISFNTEPLAKKSTRSIKSNLIAFDNEISMIKSTHILNSLIDNIKKDEKILKTSINIQKYMYVFSDKKNINISNKGYQQAFLDYDGDITNFRKQTNVNTSFNNSKYNVFLEE
jgi:hypothetical protein